MQEMIEVIRAAVASNATTEQKAAGVQACHTIAAALDTEPGKPIVLPGTLTAPLTRPSLDQLLDMMIAKLTMIASERDKSPALAPPPPPPPNGLRVPVAPIALPRGVQRPNSKPITPPAAGSKRRS